MKDRKPEDWYDYHETEWETIAIISNSGLKCYLIKVVGGSSNHVVKETIKAKGFNLDDIDWYRTEQK